MFFLFFQPPKICYKCHDLWRRIGCVEEWIVIIFCWWLFSFLFDTFFLLMTLLEANWTDWMTHGIFSCHYRMYSQRNGNSRPTAGKQVPIFSRQKKQEEENDKKHKQHHKFKNRLQTSSLTYNNTDTINRKLKPSGIEGWKNTHSKKRIIWLISISMIILENSKRRNRTTENRPKKPNFTNNI